MTARARYPLREAASALTAAVVTAAAMYWFDPDNGRLRRSLIRSRFSGAFSRAGSLSNRMQGLAARARSTFRSGAAEDAQLVGRVRSALGYAVSHPDAIRVSASQGRVTLMGDVLESEHLPLIRAVLSVKGAEEVDDRLAVHARPDVPALQGGRVRRARFGFMRKDFSPAGRLLLGASGAALILLGISHLGSRQRSMLGMLLTLAGGTALVRSTANIPLKRIVSATARRVTDSGKAIRGDGGHVTSEAASPQQSYASPETSGQRPAV
ncbi:MAG TPA: BON domain-containing protein [Steroidobacteraceae bacterium]